jgi:hypothetical protein
MIIEAYGDFVRVKHVVSMRQVNPNKASRRKPNTKTKLYSPGYLYTLLKANTCQTMLNTPSVPNPHPSTPPPSTALYSLNLFPKPHPLEARSPSVTSAASGASAPHPGARAAATGARSSSCRKGPQGGPWGVLQAAQEACEPLARRRADAAVGGGMAGRMETRDSETHRAEPFVDSRRSCCGATRVVGGEDAEPLVGEESSRRGGAGASLFFFPCVPAAPHGEGSRGRLKDDDAEAGRVAGRGASLPCSCPGPVRWRLGSSRRV